MTVLFSCFALGCQDLYLEELEPDWNPEPEPCQGKQNVCIVTTDKDQPPEDLGSAHLSARGHACQCRLIITD